VNTYNIASFGKRIPAVVFGVFDLLNDLGVEYTKESEGEKYSRGKIPVDAHAAGIVAIDAIWQDLKDSKVFRKIVKLEGVLDILEKVSYIQIKSLLYTSHFPKQN